MQVHHGWKATIFAELRDRVEHFVGHRLVHVRQHRQLGVFGLVRPEFGGYLKSLKILKNSLVKLGPRDRVNCLPFVDEQSFIGCVVRVLFDSFYKTSKCVDVLSLSELKDPLVLQNKRELLVRVVVDFIDVAERNEESLAVLQQHA